MLDVRVKHHSLFKGNITEFVKENWRKHIHQSGFQVAYLISSRESPISLVTVLLLSVLLHALSYGFYVSSFQSTFVFVCVNMSNMCFSQDKNYKTVLCLFLWCFPSPNHIISPCATSFIISSSTLHVPCSTLYF